MADGSGHHQNEFFFPHLKAQSKLRPGEIVVDMFAGGGGASHALETALARAVDIAINHNPWAIGMHAANHPYTRHLCEDVFAADPRKEVGGRLVGWMHGSPDCTHFSQALGGQPRDKAVRALAWVLVKWPGILDKTGNKPRIISLENVWQMLKWGRLIAKRDKATGRVVKLDGTVAAPGECVPVQEQYLIPDKACEGRTWRRFVAALEALGYVVDWRKLKACDYGSGTSRERLFMIARCDGEPIRWPEPTHGPGRAHPYVGGADCIDWSNPGRSIFNRPRPLARNTILRLLDGARRGDWPRPYLDALQALLDGRSPKLVLTDAEAQELFFRIGGIDSQVMAVGSGGVPRSAQDPVPTITKGGNGARPHLFRPALMPLLLGTQGSAPAKPANEPVGTITTGGATNKAHPGCARPQLFQPIIAPYYGSGSGRTGKPASVPLPSATTKARFCLAEPIIVSTCNSSGTARARLGSEPIRTVTTANGGDFAVAFPVVTEYSIDILYRMLDAPELFAAQGFPRGYIIDRTADGRRLKVHQSVGMCGNSVSPPPLIALAVANLDPACEYEAERMVA